MKADEISIVGFDPKQATREEWTLFHQYRKTRSIESDRADEYFPVAEFEMMATRDDPFGEQKRFVVDIEGAYVASFGCYLPYPDSPGYESGKHLLSGHIAVLEPFRRREIGTNLLRRTHEIMEQNDKSVLTLWTEEDSGHAFLRRIGAEGKQDAAENRLKLDEVDWEMVQGWVNEGRDRNPDTELVLFEDRVPADRLDEIAPILSDLLNTIPFDELDHGDIVITPEMMREWYERMDQLGAHHHMYLTREKDGTISGMTDVEFSPQLPDRIGQNFTGVHPDHRGRGLGKWLKASMLMYVHSRYPDATWIVTGNANSNDPMLGINHKLGFKKHKGATAYQISRDDVAKYLSSVG